MKPYEVDGIDVATQSLQPLNERPNINTEKHRGYRRILSSIRKIGLIEPLCVYREGDSHIILDGYLRWLACKELEYEIVPCILYKDKEAYTFNRMVNNLSGFQEIKMMRKSLESLDEKTIADFMTRLENTGLFASVNLKTIKKKVIKGSSRRSFQLVCNKPKPQKAKKNNKKKKKSKKKRK